MLSPLDVDLVGAVALSDLGAFPDTLRLSHASSEHFPTGLGDHGTVVDAKPHVCSKDLSITLPTHLGHHLLQALIATHATNYQHLQLNETKGEKEMKK